MSTRRVQRHTRRIHSRKEQTRDHPRRRESVATSARKTCRTSHGRTTPSRSTRNHQVPRGERVQGPGSRTRTLVARNRPGPRLRLFRAQTYRAGSRLVPSHRKLLPWPRRSTLAGKTHNPRRSLRQNCAITRSGPSKNHTPEIRNDRESSTSQQFRNNHLHETRPVQPDDRTEHSAPAGGERQESSPPIRRRNKTRKTARLHRCRRFCRHRVSKTRSRRSREISETHRDAGRDHGRNGRVDLGTASRARPGPPLKWPTIPASQNAS